MSQDKQRLPSLEALERELVKRAEQEEAGKQRRWLRLSRRVTLIIGAVVAFVAVTPWGHALADRVADLVGIGDEPTRERLSPIDEPASVVALGTTPTGATFEVVLSTNPGFGQDLSGDTCVSLDFAGGRTSDAQCLTEAARASLARGGLAVSATTAPTETGEQVLVTGFVTAAAEEVLIAVGGGGPTRAATVPLEEEEAGFVYAFVKPASTISVEVRDADGRQLFAQRLPVIEVPRP